MKKLLITAIICFASLFYIPFQTNASPLVYNTERISGLDRIETALGIAQEGWSTSQTVILCESSAYPDSIAAAPFAASLDAPILLTGGKTLDPRVVNELERLQAQKVILLGGNACLTPAIEAALDSMSLSWERIGGNNRYETSVLLAEQLNSDSLIIAYGDNFPDALSAASYAGIEQIPMVLTSKRVPSSVLEYIERNQPQDIIVIGGEAVIPTEELSKAGIEIDIRLGGQNRYETNAKVVEHMKDIVESDDLFLASGLNFPDAVAGTVLTSKLKAPLLLTAKDDIPSAVYSFMRLHMKVEPSTAKTSSGRGKVSASGGLNLRDTPYTSGRLLLTIPDGEEINITDSQGQWYRTAYQGKTGWVSANYVEILSTYRQGKIIASGGLNLRQSPSTTAEIEMTIPQGAKVSITGEQKDWYKAAYRDKTGWVFAEYVSVLDSGTIGDDRVDLSPNGKVYILGGTGVISAVTQNIIEGKASSKIADNLRDFPSLPSSLSDSDSEGSYNPTQEVLIDPFQGLPSDILYGKKIMIDPGHGGPDSGAIGPDYTYEKDNNLSIALYLNDILAQAGATVIMTRTTDVSVASNYTERADLQARVDMANNIKPDFFISIHNNANDNPDKTGTSVYYSANNPYAAKSAELSDAILQSITATVNTLNEGVRKADFYVLKNTKVPATLIEVAYLSNPYEEKRLENPIFQKNVAAAVFRGIVKHLSLM